MRPRSTIDEFRKFVKRIVSQASTDSRDTRIVFRYLLMSVAYSTASILHYDRVL